MKQVHRKVIRSETYRGRSIEARYIGPDLLCYVGPQGGNLSELGSFYIDAAAAITAGRRHVDLELKETKP